MQKPSYPANVLAKYDFKMQPTTIRLPYPFEMTVDLRTISLEEADWLYATKLGVLVLKEQTVVGTPVEPVSTTGSTGKKRNQQT